MLQFFFAVTIYRTNWHVLGYDDTEFNECRQLLFTAVVAMPHAAVVDTLAKMMMMQLWKIVHMVFTFTTCLKFDTLIKFSSLS